MILDVEEFLTPTSAVAGVLEGFEERLEQKRMAAAVSGALASGQHLLVEARSPHRYWDLHRYTPDFVMVMSIHRKRIKVNRQLQSYTEKKK